MSNELMKYAGSTLAKHDRYDEPMSRTAGRSMVVAGGTGLGLWFLAGLLPFISLPMLLVILVVGGGVLYAKN